MKGISKDLERKLIVNHVGIETIRGEFGREIDFRPRVAKSSEFAERFFLRSIRGVIRGGTGKGGGESMIFLSFFGTDGKKEIYSPERCIALLSFCLGRKIVKSFER